MCSSLGFIVTGGSVLLDEPQDRHGRTLCSVRKRGALPEDVCPMGRADGSPGPQEVEASAVLATDVFLEVEASATLATDVLSEVDASAALATDGFLEVDALRGGTFLELGSLNVSGLHSETEESLVTRSRT